METSVDNKTSNVEQEEQYCAHAIQLLSSVALPFVLNAVIELQVFEIIAKAGPNAQLSAAEIASHLPTKNPEAASMLDRMFRLLACHSVLTFSLVEKKDGNEEDDYAVERFYGLAPVGNFFVRNKDGASMGPLCNLIHNKVFIESWFELKDSVLEGGIPFNRVHGIDAFSYPSKDAIFNEVFNNAMLNHSSIIMSNVLVSYKGFENLNTLVDVGGGLGINLKITSKYPNLKGINFDLAHAIEKASSYPGVQHVGGDMFENVPEGDAIFMKWILHDWSDDHCLKLLKNCYKSIPRDGKVIVVECLYPPRPDSSASVISTTQIDVMMMTQNPGGKERSEIEFLTSGKKAGFAGIHLEAFVSNFSIMEFYK